MKMISYRQNFPNVTGANSSAQVKKPEGKDVLGDFTMNDIDGSPLDLSTHSGKVLRAAPSITEKAPK